MGGRLAGLASAVNTAYPCPVLYQLRDILPFPELTMLLQTSGHLHMLFLFPLCHLKPPSHPVSPSESLSLSPRELLTLLNPTIVPHISPPIGEALSHRAGLRSCVTCLALLVLSPSSLRAGIASYSFLFKTLQQP